MSRVCGSSAVGVEVALAAVVFGFGAGCRSSDPLSAEVAPLQIETVAGRLKSAVESCASNLREQRQILDDTKRFLDEGKLDVACWLSALANLSSACVTASHQLRGREVQPDTPLKELAQTVARIDAEAAALVFATLFLDGLHVDPSDLDKFGAQAVEGAFRARFFRGTAFDPALSNEDALACIARSPLSLLTRRGELVDFACRSIERAAPLTVGLVSFDGTLRPELRTHLQQQVTLRGDAHRTLCQLFYRFARLEVEPMTELPAHDSVSCIMRHEMTVMTRVQYLAWIGGLILDEDMRTQGVADVVRRQGVTAYRDMMNAVLLDHAAAALQNLSNDRLWQKVAQYQGDDWLQWIEELRAGNVVDAMRLCAILGDLCAVVAPDLYEGDLIQAGGRLDSDLPVASPVWNFATVVVRDYAGLLARGSTMGEQLGDMAWQGRKLRPRTSPADRAQVDRGLCLLRELGACIAQMQQLVATESERSHLGDK